MNVSVLCVDVEFEHFLVSVSVPCVDVEIEHLLVSVSEGLHFELVGFYFYPLVSYHTRTLNIVIYCISQTNNSRLIILSMHSLPPPTT